MINPEVPVSVALVFSDVASLASNPITLIFLGFTLWMLVDAVRREEWLWVIMILLFPMINAPLYFFLVYRQARGFAPSMRGFELPGAQERSRIKELETKIHHLDKAAHHLELGDIYFQQGKLDQALESYQRAFERDQEDIDIRAHYGQCLLRLNRPGEAKRLLESVCLENPRHDYGHSMMALAEARALLGEKDEAIQTWRRVLEDNAYSRARVQLAELLHERGEAAQAKAELAQVLNDDAHSPTFHRRRDAVWVKRARKLLKTIA